MSKPATLNATVALVRKSKLVAEDRLRGFLANVKKSGLVGVTPAALLTQMVAAGLLTGFQAEHLRHGRYQGFRLGNYLIRDRIGTGGMGHIFLADHVGLGRPVAVKVLRPTALAAPLACERFVREAYAAAKLSHPNIVSVYDINADAHPPYLVMEYIDGVSLQAAVARHGPLTAGEAAECGRQVALGLQHAHECGLVHRDVKPANVLLDRRGTAKVLDLGIVHVVGECLTEQVDAEMILGTVEYLSPEQAYGCRVDTRADVYSLGATLYFLLTGRPPLPDGDVRTKLLQLCSVEPAPLRAVRPDVPPGLAAVVHRMLAKDPAARHQTPVEVAAALTPWADAVGFPGRLFGKNSATVSDDSSQTMPVPAELLQPAPVGCRTPLPGRLESGPGTVDLCKEPTAPAPACELTLRTQLDLATSEAELELPPEPTPAERRDSLLRLVCWSAVGLLVTTVGGFTLWALLVKG